MTNSLLKRFPAFLVLLLGALCLCGGNSLAESIEVPYAAAATGLPSELGEIIYQTNPDLPCQVYIIGNSHRSSASGNNGVNTVPAQVQTYRIGEWLIRNNQVELLLPEGFFGSKGRSEILATADGFDGPTLEKTLADTSTFINADLLLHRNYGIGLQQVEDREMYRTVREYLQTGLKEGADQLASFGLELEYLQERRSAAILQRIPEVIDSEYRQGKISEPRAMLTIGMAHIHEIIKFIEEGRIDIPAPQIGDSGFQPFSERLALADEKVGVTVIVPRVILDDQETMYMAKLEPQPEAGP